jgi:hypothetical protein
VPRIEPPLWYRVLDLAAWDAPDAHEQAMMAGCAGHRCWPGAAESAWPGWPQFLHEEHARRRWGNAKDAYRQEHPALAEQEFADLVSAERRVREDERRR